MARTITDTAVEPDADKPVETGTAPARNRRILPVLAANTRSGHRRGHGRLSDPSRLTSTPHPSTSGRDRGDPPTGWHLTTADMITVTVWNAIPGAPTRADAVTAHDPAARNQPPGAAFRRKVPGQRRTLLQSAPPGAHVAQASRCGRRAGGPDPVRPTEPLAVPGTGAYQRDLADTPWTAALGHRHAGTVELAPGPAPHWQWPARLRPPLPPTANSASGWSQRPGWAARSSRGLAGLPPAVPLAAMPAAVLTARSGVGAVLASVTTGTVVSGTATQSGLVRSDMASGEVR